MTTPFRLTEIYITSLQKWRPIYRKVFVPYHNITINWKSKAIKSTINRWKIEYENPLITSNIVIDSMKNYLLLHVSSLCFKIAKILFKKKLKTNIYDSISLNIFSSVFKKILSSHVNIDFS